jgi:hypothetical protein
MNSSVTSAAHAVGHPIFCFEIGWTSGVHHNVLHVAPCQGRTGKGIGDEDEDTTRRGKAQNVKENKKEGSTQAFRITFSFNAQNCMDSAMDAGMKEARQRLDMLGTLVRGTQKDLNKIV